MAERAHPAVDSQAVLLTAAHLKVQDLIITSALDALSAGMVGAEKDGVATRPHQSWIVFTAGAMGAGHTLCNTCTFVVEFLQSLSNHNDSYHSDSAIIV